MKFRPAQRFATALLVAALIATACTSNEPAALPEASPTPVATVTPVPPATTAVPPSPAPVPQTAEPAAVRTPTVAPQPAVNNVNFRDVTPGVGPFDYPVKGIELIANDIEAEALWAVVEYNNVIARVSAAGSIADLPSWDTLKERELVPPDFAADVEAFVDGERLRILDTSALSELAITRGETELVLTLCYQLEFEVRDPDDGEITRNGSHTTTRAYTFRGNGPASVQVRNVSVRPVDLERMVPCNLADGAASDG